MVRTAHALGVMAVATAALAAQPAAAEVRDAVYRGTLVCDKLPFTLTRMREAIEVTITGGTVSYTHVVRLRAQPEAAVEQGSGTLNGQAISLQGAWNGGGREYKAVYSGTFVRRSAKLSGAQTWTEGGKSITRACSGAIKRPLKLFLPREKKP